MSVHKNIVTQNNRMWNFIAQRFRVCGTLHGHAWQLLCCSICKSALCSITVTSLWHMLFYWESIPLLQVTNKPAVHHGRRPCTCLGCPSSHTPPEAGCLQETLPVLPGMLQPEQAARAHQPPPVWDLWDVRLWQVCILFLMSRSNLSKSPKQ